MTVQVVWPPCTVGSEGTRSPHLGRPLCLFFLPHQGNFPTIPLSWELLSRYLLPPSFWVSDSFLKICFEYQHSLGPKNLETGVCGGGAACEAGDGFLPERVFEAPASPGVLSPSGSPSVCKGAGGD